MHPTIYTPFTMYLKKKRILMFAKFLYPLSIYIFLCNLFFKIDYVNILLIDNVLVQIIPKKECRV